VLFPLTVCITAVGYRIHHTYNSLFAPYVLSLTLVRHGSVDDATVEYVGAVAAGENKNLKDDSPVKSIDNRFPVVANVERVEYLNIWATLCT
jgi:hypothetical protein